MYIYMVVCMSEWVWELVEDDEWNIHLIGGLGEWGNYTFALCSWELLACILIQGRSTILNLLICVSQPLPIRKSRKIYRKGSNHRPNIEKTNEDAKLALPFKRGGKPHVINRRGRECFNFFFFLFLQRQLLGWWEKRVRPSTSDRSLAQGNSTYNVEVRKARRSGRGSLLI